MRIISIEENVDIDYRTHELYTCNANSYEPKYKLCSRSTFTGDSLTLMRTDTLDNIRKIMKQIADAYEHNIRIFFIESEK